jgi:hypothetical protein
MAGEQAALDQATNEQADLVVAAEAALAAARVALAAARARKAAAAAELNEVTARRERHLMCRHL